MWGSEGKNSALKGTPVAFVKFLFCSSPATITTHSLVNILNLFSGVSSFVPLNMFKSHILKNYQTLSLLFYQELCCFFPQLKEASMVITSVSRHFPRSPPPKKDSFSSYMPHFLASFFPPITISLLLNYSLC